MRLTPDTLTRLVLAFVITVFAGSHPRAAAGEVICGADGAARIVAYDFERGAPVEASPAFDHCGDCLTGAAAPPAVSAPAAVFAAAAVAPIVAARTPALRPARRGPGARAPPV